MNLKPKTLDYVVKNEVSNRLSYSYDSYDNVARLHIQQMEQEYTVVGVVNVLGKKSVCSLTINRDKEITNFQCDCSWCKADSGCAHIGAVILKLDRLAIQEFPYTYESEKEHTLHYEEKNKKQREEEKYKKDY